MRKIKTLLMIMILGMLFVSCTSYNNNPSVNTEELTLLYEADTVQYVVVTDESNNVTYFRLDDGKAIPEVTLQDEQIALPIIGSIIVLLWVSVMAYSVGRD